MIFFLNCCSAASDLPAFLSGGVIKCPLSPPFLVLTGPRPELQAAVGVNALEAEYQQNRDESSEPWADSSCALPRLPLKEQPRVFAVRSESDTPLKPKLQEGNVVKTSTPDHSFTKLLQR